MNKVILMGRLTRDPDVRYGTGERSTTIARYTLAVDRRFKRDNEQTADFISCVAFDRNAEFAEKYLKQGTKIAITGRIQTGSYTKSASENNGGYTPAARPEPSAAGDGFMNIPDGVEDEGLPF